MAEVVDSVKYPSLPSNYVSIAQLQERWLKEKEKEKQENEEKEKQHPLARNGSAKGWREVGKEAKLKKEVDGTRGEKKKRMGSFVKRETRVERVLMIDVGGEEEMMGGESSKGKCKEVEEEVGNVCMVGERDVERGVAGKNCGVGFRGRRNSGRKMGGGVREVSEKGDCVERLGQERNGEKKKVSVDVKGKTNEKVRVSGAFRAYGEKEVEQVATVCGVEVVGESNVDRGNAGKRCGVRFRGKKRSGRKMGDGVGEVRDKADSGEQSGQEHNAEKEEVSVDVKERTNEKVRGRGAFRAYSDKGIDVPLIDSEAGLKMKIERDLGDLSLSNRRYGHGRSSVGVYDDKRRYASSRRYEPRKMLKQRDSSFVWVKKGESSNANVAEMETQVGFSGQSTGRSKLFSQ